jgi:hypothetical protein
MAEVQNCPVCKSDNAQITQLGALNDALLVIDETNAISTA